MVPGVPYECTHVKCIIQYLLGYLQRCVLLAIYFRVFLAYLLVVIPSFLLTSLALANYQSTLYLWVYLFWTFLINRVIIGGPLRLAYFTLHNVLKINPCRNMLVPLFAYTTFCLSNSSVDGHLSFHFLVIMHITAVNIHIQVFMWISFRFQKKMVRGGALWFQQ